MASFESVNRFKTSSVKWDMYKEKLGIDNFISFSIADADYQTAPPILEALNKRINHGVFGYTMVDEHYLQVIQTWVQRRYNYHIEKDWIITSPGVIPSIIFSIRSLTSKDAQIVIQTPVYNNFAKTVVDSNRQLVINSLQNVRGRFTMDFHDLEERFQDGAEMLLLCNPHNPIGRCWTYQEIEKVVFLCKKYNVYLVSDEIHCDIILNKRQFTSVGLFLNVYDRMIICTAPSKTFNIAGLHLANMFVCNQELRVKVQRAFLDCALMAPNLLGMNACVSAYTECDQWLEEQLVHLEGNFEYLRNYFITNLPQAIITNLEATYLVWIDMAFMNMSSTEVVQGLIKYGVIVNDGLVYGDEGKTFIRLNIACSREQLVEGLQRIKNFVYEQQKHY
jgi:cystathionine beta-lyase